MDVLLNGIAVPAFRCTVLKHNFVMGEPEGLEGLFGAALLGSWLGAWATRGESVTSTKEISLIPSVCEVCQPCHEPEPSEPEAELCPRSAGCPRPDGALRRIVYDLALDEGAGFEWALLLFAVAVLFGRWYICGLNLCGRRNVRRRVPKIYRPPGAEDR